MKNGALLALLSVGALAAAAALPRASAGSRDTMRPRVPLVSSRLDAPTPLSVLAFQRRHRTTR